MEASFWDHVEALRLTVLRCLAVIVVGFCLALAFHQPLLQLLTLPLNGVHAADTTSSRLVSTEMGAHVVHNSSSRPMPFHLPQGARLLTESSSLELTRTTAPLMVQPGERITYLRPKESPRLLLLGPVEGIGMTIKVACWVGLVATSPIWLFMILQFVKPALRTNEAGIVIPFLTLSTLFIAGGMALAFFVTIPIANRFLFLFNAEIGANAWTLSNYLDYTILLVLANGLAFELFVLLLFLIHFGRVSAQALARKRRLMVVMIFIAAALLTPPDVVTQCLLALPMLLLYELGIVYARLRHHKVVESIT